MSGFWFTHPKSLCWLSLILCGSGVHAQTCMVLSPPTIAANGTASLDLSLFSPQGKGPAALQWIFQYSSTNIQTLTVDDGTELTAAGKTAMCAGGATAFNCLAVGDNKRTIGNGIIAKLTAVLAPGATMVPILIKSALAASPDGYLIRVMSKVLSDPDANVTSECRPQLQRRPVGK